MDWNPKSHEIYDRFIVERIYPPNKFAINAIAWTSFLIRIFLTQSRYKIFKDFIYCDLRSSTEFELELYIHLKRYDSTCKIVS